MFTTSVRIGQDPQDVGKMLEQRLIIMSDGDRRTTSFVPLLGSRSDVYSTGSLPETCLAKTEEAGKGETPHLVPKSESGNFIPLDGKSRCSRLWKSDSSYALVSQKVGCQSINEENETAPPPSYRSADVGSGLDIIRQRLMRSRTPSMTSFAKQRLLPRPSSFSSPRRSSSFEWMQKTEVYNVASKKLRGMLQRPALNLPDLNGVSEGSFAGALLEIFPDSAFPRPSSVNQADWDEVMGVGKWRYPAEDSGLVTFWQAILVNVHCLRCGLGALLSLTSSGCQTARVDESQLFECVTYPMGQLVNTIGLSWEYHHVRNLKKMDEADRQRINIQGLSHRHDNLKRKSWAVLLRLQGLASLKTQAERVQAVRDAHKHFEEFYVYLIYTVRIIMEDTLFLYRSSLNEQQMSCLADARGICSDSLDAELIWQACMVIAGGTPPSHSKKRFGYMGHGWLARQTTLRLGLSWYHRMFLNPIKQVVKAARASDDVSSE